MLLEPSRRRGSARVRFYARDLGRRRRREATAEGAPGSAAREPAGSEALEPAVTGPWPEPVRGAAILDELRSRLRRHLVLPAHGDVAISLWALGTHAFDAFDAFGVFPRLLLSSPQKRCGKSTAMDLLSRASARALPLSNVSAAALFREIELHRPTVLIDEADTFLAKSEALRGIINSGHSRDLAFVLRVDGPGRVPVKFSTWAPVAIAMIGRPPPTILDRSIEVRLERKAHGEHAERVEREEAAAFFARWRRKAERWARDEDAALRALRPEAPGALDDRAADNWRPLLAVAERAGGEWPRLASEAALALSRGRGEDDDDAVLLLTDIRAVFRRLQGLQGSPGVQRVPSGQASDGPVTDRLSTAKLLEALHAMEDRPWREIQRGRPLSPHGLARLLRPFKVFPTTFQATPGAATAVKGYRLDSFQEAFRRYLPLTEP
ncbi:MAG: DUF3631 domain-containing protein [Planctomycetes bacterium]|nr:DUF3631 domain-containing protein [Planctomycetota bacterium]